jgi:small subunit ribosomal protein S7
MRMNEKMSMMDKFVNYVMYDGKKSLAKKIMDDTFEEIKAKGQKNPQAVFDKAIENIVPKIEVRPKRV